MAELTCAVSFCLYALSGRDSVPPGGTGLMGVVVLSLSGGTALGGGPGVTEGPRLLAGFLAGGVDFALGSGLACVMKIET